MRRKTLECIDFNESNVRTIVRNNLFLFDGQRIIRAEFFELKLLRFNFSECEYYCFKGNSYWRIFIFARKKLPSPAYFDNYSRGERFRTLIYF